MVSAYNDLITMTTKTMKKLKCLAVAVLSISFLAGPLMALAGDQSPPAKLKPYTLKTCVVSGDKLGEMAPPYVFRYKDREIKFCCKDCVKDFQKDPAQYLKKIEKAEAKAKAKK